jgi:WD40 repeat protein
VNVIDLATGSSETLGREPGDVVGLAFAPDGDRVATVCDDGTARVYSIMVRDSRPIVASEKIERVEFSRDGKKLIAASSAGVVWIHDEDVPRDAVALLAWLEAATSATIGADGTLLGLGR